MNHILCKGGMPLQGSVKIQGSKNAALPILAATLMTEGICHIRNCPKISDVYSMLYLLEKLCCEVKWDLEGVRIDTRNVRKCEPCKDTFSCMRSSICLLGALIGRERDLTIESPGGCVIGERPIDLHLSALEKMGVQFTFEESKIHAVHHGLHGAHITLPFPSVGATENVIMAATLAEGKTILKGAAMEPEVRALCKFLNACGAKIKGAGTDLIEVEGVQNLEAATYEIPSDRIVAGTYLLTLAGCGGNMFLQNAPAKDMKAVLEILRELGVGLELSEKGIFVQADGRVKRIPFVKTMPYPGFPTDLQSLLLTVLTVGEGETILEETVFENRFKVVDELRKMGACIEKIDERKVCIKGVECLRGAGVKALELRGGAALITAGLMAKGQTRIQGVKYIERGYENICRDYKELGARITSG